MGWRYEFPAMGECMDTGSFLGLMVTDPAAAWFSASGGQNVSDKAVAPTEARGLDDGSDGGMGYGLLPSAAELPVRGVGLQGAESQHDRGRDDLGLDYTQRVVQALGADPYHFGFPDGPGADGMHAQLLPVAGGVRAPAAESTPLEISVRPGAAAAFDALSNINPDMDITGTLGLIRDTNDLGAYLKQRDAEDAVSKMKESISRLMIRPPTEAQLGALPEYVNNGQGVAVPVYNQQDLLDRYRSALRMVALDRQGTIDLDYGNWKIKTIGKSRLTPEQFVKTVRDQYQQAFTEGVAEADGHIKSRGYIFDETMPLDLQRGLYADRFAKRRLGKFSESEGVPEGPGQILAFGRWGYYKNTSGLHAQPDILIDPGLEHWHILDGKATRLDLSASMRRQLEGYHDLGVPTVEATTPQGHILVPPRNPEKIRSRK